MPLSQRVRNVASIPVGLTLLRPPKVPARLATRAVFSGTSAASAGGIRLLSDGEASIWAPRLRVPQHRVWPAARRAPRGKERRREAHCSHDQSDERERNEVRCRAAVRFAPSARPSVPKVEHQSLHNRLSSARVFCIRLFQLESPTSRQHDMGSAGGRHMAGAFIAQGGEIKAV